MKNWLLLVSVVAVYAADADEYVTLHAHGPVGTRIVIHHDPEMIEREIFDDQSVTYIGKVFPEDSIVVDLKNKLGRDSEKKITWDEIKKMGPSQLVRIESGFLRPSVKLSSYNGHAQMTESLSPFQIRLSALQNIRYLLDDLKNGLERNKREIMSEIELAGMQEYAKEAFALHLNNYELTKDLADLDDAQAILDQQYQLIQDGHI